MPNDKLKNAKVSRNAENDECQSVEKMLKMTNAKVSRNAENDECQSVEKC
jgi:hypothetical protein